MKPTIFCYWRHLLVGFTCMLTVLSMLAQEKHSRFSISGNLGPNGSFFVRSYQENQEPQAAFRFYEKNFIGLTGGLELKYRLSKNGSLIGGYTRSVNSQHRSFYGERNGIQLSIMDFTLQHKVNYFYAGYERKLFKKYSGLRWQLAMFYTRFQQQEIEVLGNNIQVWERTTRNAGLEDLGAFVGLHQSWNIDTHFSLGIQTRFFYNLTSLIAEEVTLTPTLTYHFDSKKRKKSSRQ